MAVILLIRERKVTGTPAVILSQIDDHIYRTVSGRLQGITSATPLPYEDTLLDIMTYTATRLLLTSMNVEERLIAERFLSMMLNALYFRHDRTFYREPLPANISYKLPRLILVLTLCYKAKLSRTRITHILQELQIQVLSQFPYMELNRVYLYFALSHLVSTVPLPPPWMEHTARLRASIHIDRLLHDLPANQLALTDGITGLYLLLQILPQGFGLTYTRQSFKDKILASSLATTSDYSVMEEKEFVGLDGILGLHILYHHLQRDDTET